MCRLSCNDIRFYQGIGTEIVSEGIFERFPELIPAVGENYYRKDGKHRKLLIVGESNCFPKSLETESVFQYAEKWYRAENVGLIPKTMEWKTRMSNDTGYPKFVWVFDIVNTVLRDNGIEPKGDRLYETAFYNYFLRPALDPGNDLRKKIKPEKIDNDVAGIALEEILKRLQTDLVVFVSTTAYNAFVKYLKGKYGNNIHVSDSIHKVSHPSSPWWNRNGGIYGRKLFRDILEKYYIVR